ncbi:MAG: hypothetical protein DMF55_09790 [Acidobacteria bacterium]|nr:MAG: hypothetical protein DMF55_09790 [Acidobacteriota bacterium]
MRRKRALLLCALPLAAFSIFACRRTEIAARSAGPSRETGAPAAAVTPIEDADETARSPRPATAPAPVIWLGLDGLDWEILDRLSREGKMPNWARLASEGFQGNLASFLPVLSPILWTTAATGVGADVHRILDFQETDPRTGVKLPISGFSRAVPAVWNVASAAGKKVGVVGWWATHPAEEVNGFFVSDRASPLLFGDLPRAGAAYPATLSAGVEQIVARDGAVTDAELARFVDVPPAEISSARASGAGMENPIVALSRILAATRVNHRIARDLYDRTRPDLTALYLEGTDEIGHVFAPYSPPRLDCTSVEDFARYHRAVDVYYGVVDRMLGQWMRRAREDGATLLVHSDHGFRWGADRTCARSSLNWSTAAYWHRLTGVFAAWGARVRPSKARAKVSIFDVAPTVLALLDLPADRRMTGKPVTAAFAGLRPPPRKDVFSTATVRRVAAESITAEQASEYAKKLKALGYLTGAESRPVAPAAGDRPGMTEGAWNNLGVYLRETVGDLRAAEPALLKSLELRPDYASPMFNPRCGSRRAGADDRRLGRRVREQGAASVRALSAGEGCSALPGKRAFRARARSVEVQEVARLPGRPRSALAIRGKDHRHRDLERARPLSDLPGTSGRGGRALSTVAEVEAGPAGRGPVAEHGPPRHLRDLRGDRRELAG